MKSKSFEDVPDGITEQGVGHGVYMRYVSRKQGHLGGLRRVIFSSSRNQSSSGCSEVINYT